jgi:hypothetical protein
MKRIEYRSAGLPVGAFNQMGAVHAHIDGADTPELVLGIVKALEVRGNPGTMDYVLSSVIGPQRELEPETYESHTPVLDGEEAFDFFSNSLIRDRKDALVVLDAITAMLTGTRGAIVEIEQNVGWLNASGWQTLPLTEQLNIIQPQEVRLAPKKSMRYEIHHNIELPKEQGAITLSKLARYCRQQGMMFGGWFVFDDDSNWGYWSNAFSNESDVRQLVANDQQIIAEFLASEGLQVQPCTLVELVLGIWHTQG